MVVTTFEMVITTFKVVIATFKVVAPEKEIHYGLVELSQAIAPQYAR